MSTIFTIHWTLSLCVIDKALRIALRPNSYVHEVKSNQTVNMTPIGRFVIHVSQNMQHVISYTF